MFYRAFKAHNKDCEYFIEQYPNPMRWKDNFVGKDNPIRDVTNWSSEIKYMKDGKISDRIKNIPLFFNFRRTDEKCTGAL